MSTATKADRSALVVLGRVNAAKRERAAFLTSPLVGEVGESSSRVGGNATTLPGASPPTRLLRGDLPHKGGGEETTCPPTLAPALRREGGGASPPGEGWASLANPSPPTPLPQGARGEDKAPFPPREGGWGVRSLEIRVLAARAEKLSAPELVTLIDAFDRQWNPSVILFETNAAFLGIKDLLKLHTRFGPKLKGITQTADKSARVAAFSVAVENGAFRLKGNDTADAPDEPHRELYEEMITFPYADRDDLVDAAATGCAYLLDRREPRAW